MIELRPVTGVNWRGVAALEVKPAQQEFVAASTYYLSLCAYGDLWQPLAAYHNEEVCGFLMWAVEGDTCWLGGIIVDRRKQGAGLGRAMVEAAMAHLPYQKFALSYDPLNETAAKLYKSIGFVETGEMEDTEIVARLAR
ncbi:GNAT family N-acetyltransferase [Longispora albida]|uniref:GNAT family N-acetyltransferase n=1 Tax=Longispora albida TaxID=203523 RepID=UPI0003816630|nr:GNAT family N-acetyltransferase [Longispora albida]